MFSGRYLLVKLRNSFTVLLLNKNIHSASVCKAEFKSRYSLDQIYPNSSLNFAKPQTIPSSEKEFSGYVPLEKLDITYSRSSGPGGQHVNKVNTKVEIRFHVEKADWIPENVKEKLAELHHNNITKEGFFIVRSDKTRMQTLNLADCMDKIRCYIREAAKPPPEDLPETLALLKKRKEKAASERLRQKRHSSAIRRFQREGLDCPDI